MPIRSKHTHLVTNRKGSLLLSAIIGGAIITIAGVGMVKSVARAYSMTVTQTEATKAQSLVNELAEYFRSLSMNDVLNTKMKNFPFCTTINGETSNQEGTFSDSVAALLPSSVGPGIIATRSYTIRVMNLATLETRSDLCGQPVNVLTASPLTSNEAVVFDVKVEWTSYRANRAAEATVISAGAGLPASTTGASCSGTFTFNTMDEITDYVNSLSTYTHIPNSTDSNRGGIGWNFHGMDTYDSDDAGTRLKICQLKGFDTVVAAHKTSFDYGHPNCTGDLAARWDERVGNFVVEDACTVSFFNPNEPYFLDWLMCGCTPAPAAPPTPAPKQACSVWVYQGAWQEPRTNFMAFIPGCPNPDPVTGECADPANSLTSVDSVANNTYFHLQPLPTEEALYYTGLGTFGSAVWPNDDSVPHASAFGSGLYCDRVSTRTIKFEPSDIALFDLASITHTLTPDGKRWNALPTCEQYPHAPERGVFGEMPETWTNPSDGQTYRFLDKPFRDGGICGTDDCQCFMSINEDPLIIDMNGEGIELGSSVLFDFGGGPSAHFWPTNPQNSFFLVLDKDRNGKIDGIGELFGNTTVGPDTKLAANGFEALKKYDSNVDGFIDDKDPIFGQLQLWGDTSFDGVSDQDELHPLTRYGIEAIDLQYLEVNEVNDKHGNLTLQRSVAYGKNGEMKRIMDVWLVPGRASDVKKH